jgi:hypothetical protein
MKRGRMPAVSNTTTSEYTAAGPAHRSGGHGVDGGAVTYATCASYLGTCRRRSGSRSTAGSNAGLTSTSPGLCHCVVNDQEAVNRCTVKPCARAWGGIARGV